MKIIACFIIVISALLFNQKGYAQFYFIENKLNEIEVEFLRKKIEVEEGKTFFNVLKIKNPTNQKLSFEANFSYPADWTFMGERSRNIILNPLDSILIAYRAAPSINAKGEIGYAIVAALVDDKGNTFKNEYTFVNIPKISGLRFKPKNRIIYFDQLKKQTVISLLLSNQGNTEEYIDLNFDLSQGITIEGAQEGLYRSELTLDANCDTIVTLPVKLVSKGNMIANKFHRIQVKAITKDTVFNSSIWAKELDNNYLNDIPYTYKMLNIEAIAQNIFSNETPNYNFHINGYFLPKGKNNYFYSFQSYGTRKSAKDLWIYSRMLLQLQNKHLSVEIGDISNELGHDMFGRGAYVSYKTKSNFKIRTAASTSMIVDAYRAGMSVTQSFNTFGVELGGSYEEDNYINANSIIGFSNFGVQTQKYGNLRAYGGISQAIWQQSKQKILSYSFKLNYNYLYKNLNLNLNILNTPKEYFGRLAGRDEVRINAQYNLSNKNYLSNNFYFFRSTPPIYLNESIISTNNNNTVRNKLLYNSNITPTLLIGSGVVYEKKLGSNFYGVPNSKLKTNSAFVHIITRKRNRFEKSSFNAYFTGGYNFATDYYLGSDTINHKIYPNWFSAVLSVGYRSQIWGFNVLYYHGPYSINQQFKYFYNKYNSKNIIIMPFLDMFVYQKYIKLAVRPNFNYNVPAKTSRLGMNSELIIYPGHEWEFTLSNTYNYTASKDLHTDVKTTFSTNYFEFRIRKSFNFNQPRYQYHNIKFYFFKDLNGNNIKEPDEPGIRDVLLSISLEDKNADENIYNTASHFMSVDLLSDINGFISYGNIPNGFYTIEYKPIGKMVKAFASEKTIENIVVSSDRVYYIPYHENNKIFGKIILNRSKLSNLGKIDPSNIKVTATNSKGKRFSTLTDASGNYSIYIPSVDRYKVRVNNIYYENFELEQNDYQIQLNGYKQFEVNFIFNEKRRKIRFSTSYDYNSSKNESGIEIIRRTNLSGTIKDATTLEPVVANIKIFNDKGEIITEGKSNLRTGIFALSFVAGNDYIMEVSADEYWFHAEKLYSQQIVTFKNLKKNILLKSITVGQLIPMKTLNFEAGSYDIPVTSFPELERLMKVLKKNPSVKISVHGHADDLEILDSDKDLALERAKLVAKYLIANGYNRVKYSGHSNTKPIADNDTEDGRKLNRRVEIIVTGK